jgi:hypothetical protein
VPRLLAVLLVVLVPCGARAADTPADEMPADDVLESRGTVIGEIHIETRDIFEPGEGYHLFQIANRLHRTTRANVIRSQLLFKEGDRYDRRVLDESERALRDKRYLYDAEIRPVAYHGNQVDLEVVTKDVWTTNLGVGLGRSGGANSTRFMIQDTNLLGTGKGLTLERVSDVDRTTSLLRYDDQAVLGSHVRLGLAYSSNSDGSERWLDLGRPFYSLDTRWSSGLTVLSQDKVDTLYALGHITDRFRHQQDLFEIRGGLSHGLVDGWTRRWSTGFTYLRDRFEPVAATDGQPGTTPGFAVPGDRTLAFPWIAYDTVEDRFLEAHNMNQIQRTEDLKLGGQMHFRLGWSSPAFGGDRNVGVLDATGSLGFKPSEDQTVLLSSELSGRWGVDEAENARLGASARYFWRDFGEHLFFVTLQGDMVTNPDPETQLLLGGDNGLRGYPLRYQDGERRALLTLEQRFFTDLYPFKLFHVGGAVFFDAGRTWGRSNDPASLNYGLLKDVGVGLRLSSSRSGLGNVVHIDLAFPLDGDGSINNLQWLVSTKAGF